MLKVDAATRWSVGLWAIFVVLMFGNAMGWHKLADHQGLAAWAQAISAAAALYASYNLAKRSHQDAIERDEMAVRRLEADRQAGRKRTVEHCGASLHRVRAICTDLLVETCGDEDPGLLYFEAARADIGVIFDLMMKLDLSLLNGWAETKPVAEGLSTIRMLMAYLDTMIEVGARGDPSYRKIFHPVATNIPEQLKKSQAELIRLYDA